MAKRKKAIIEKKQDARIFRGYCRVLLLTLTLCSFLALPATALPLNNFSPAPTKFDTNSTDLTIIVRNIDSGAGISGARIYLDSGYEGVTSGDKGILTIFSVAEGPHSLRVVKRGFMENITDVTFPVERQAIILLHPSKIVPIGTNGPVEERIDIVFVPSNTEYDCIKQQKILTDYYSSNEENFRNDANNLVRKFLFTLDNKTSKNIDLPENFRDRFNFYYYSDPGDFADAFNGCAGTLPEDYWDDAPFTDVAIIIYPKYRGTYKGPPCEPDGCSNGMGPGVKTWYKTPASSELLFIHEAGHAVFGLIDTYCGETYYTQNNPYPNVWGSQTGCTLAAENNQWNSLSCRQIAQPAKKGNAESCEKNFWRYDPEPDIMETLTVSGKFGSASTLHIRYILENINRWKL